MPQNKEQEQKHDFGYSRGSGKGPEDWGKLNPRWRICNDGAMQSPIDLNNRVAVRPELGPLLRSYKPAQAAVTNRGHDIMVKLVFIFVLFFGLHHIASSPDTMQGCI